MQKVKDFVRWVRKPNKTFTEQVIEVVFVLIPAAFLIRTIGFGLYQVPTGSMETTMLVGERFFADKFTVIFRGVQRGDIVSFNAPEGNELPFFHYSDNKWVNLWQQYVWGPENWTKRVIGIPGDSVKSVMEDGKPVVYLKKAGEADYTKLDEPYLNQYPLVATYDADKTGRTFAWKSYDQSKPLNDQPFYNLTDKELWQGAAVMQACGQGAIRNPGTPRIERQADGATRNIDEFEVTLGENEYWLMGDNREGSDDSRVWGPLNRKKQHIHGRIVFRIFSNDPIESWLILDILLHPIAFWKSVRWSRCMQVVR